MSKKNLLSESTIRKFMKFANIEALADNFLKEGTYMEAEEDMMQEEEEMDMEAPADDMEAAADDMEDAPVDDMEMAVDDMEGEEEEMQDMEDEGGEELPPEAVAALERAVEDAVDSLLASLAPYGVQGDVEVEDGAEAELPGDEGPEDVADEEPVVDDMEMIDEEAVINETLDRVTRRLRAMNESAKADAKREALADRIAEAVAKRLRK